MHQVVAKLEALVDEYTARFNNIPDEEFSNKPAADKWSKKEIVGHLIDSAQNNIQRFVRAQYQHKPLVVYNQEAWVAAANYQQYDRQRLIELWQLLNKHICTILANMPPEIYSRECNVGGDAEKLVTVQFIAEDYIVHHLHHIKQILSN